MNSWVNEGATDRMIRIVLAVILAVIGMFSGGPWAVVLYVLALLSLLTGLLGICPLYKLFGIDTAKHRT